MQNMQREYSDVNTIETEGVDNYQVVSVKGAFKTILYIEGEAVGAYFLNEKDTDVLINKLYADNDWED